MQTNIVKYLNEVIHGLNIEERENVEKDNENNPKKNIISLEGNSKKEIEEEQIFNEDEDDLNSDLVPVEELKKEYGFQAYLKEYYKIIKI